MLVIHRLSDLLCSLRLRGWSRSAGIGLETEWLLPAPPAGMIPAKTTAYGAA